MGKKRKKRPGKVKQPPQSKQHGIGRPVPRSILDKVEQWPYHEVLISKEWDGELQLVQILASRRGSGGDLLAGVFLVDLGCLGVKDGMLMLLDRGEYRQLVETFSEAEELVPCEPDLAAKILLTALEYADDIGFAPHPDAVEALVVLRGADPSAADVEVPVGGEDGKPLYVQGPRDNPQRVLRTLEASVGEGNFDFILAGDHPEDFVDEDFDEDLEL